MEIQEIKDKNVWEDFLLGCTDKTFLNSWNWGEFQIKMGNKIWRLGIYNREQRTENREQLISVALVVKTVAKRGTFLLVPHGPNIKSEIGTRGPDESQGGWRGGRSPKVDILENLLGKLNKIAKEEKADFIRISPIWERSDENTQMFKSLKFKPAPIHAHPEASWKLDIRPSEEELLAKMRKTTRYLIRQAQKNQDIEILQSNKIEDIDIFDKLQQEVVKEQHFIPFSLKYLKSEFLAFQPDNQISLFFGKHKGEIVTGALVLFWSKIGFYHHAALVPQYHKIPVAYALMWEAIKEAKKRGCILFDFWGFVDPQKNPRHPWAGPTLFKMGFGGKAYEYVKTQDFPLSKKYWLTYIFEKLRKNRRGL